MLTSNWRILNRSLQLMMTTVNMATSTATTVKRHMDKRAMVRRAMTRRHHKRNQQSLKRRLGMLQMRRRQKLCRTR